MKEEERKYIEMIINSDQGLFSSEELRESAFQKLGLGDDKEEKVRHRLVKKGYLEEQEGTDKEGWPTNLYRVDKKGLLVFASPYKRMWELYKSEISHFVSLIALLVSILVGLNQLGWI